MLHPDFTSRLGCGGRGWEEVKEHAFFNGIDWQKMYAKEIPPPVKPDVTQANCTADADLADQLIDHKPREIPAEQQRHFDGWGFNVELKGNGNDNGEGDSPNISKSDNVDRRITINVETGQPLDRNQRLSRGTKTDEIQLGFDNSNANSNGKAKSLHPPSARVDTDSDSDSRSQ